jgi:hypothetical protein
VPLLPHTDVKRVFAVRDALSLLDFEDETAETLNELLLRCLIDPLFLRVAEGKRFLAFIFHLHPRFVDDIHMAIKNQIPSSKPAVLKAYGDVYFRAWRSAEGEFLTKIEEGCLQDLMQRAVHAATPQLFSAVKRILAVFHEAKRQRGVDEMLLRLYEPILWRSLKVANPAVRCHAGTLLVAAFPLQNPDAPRSQFEEGLQRQFTHLEDMLADADPAVRVVGVQGISKVLGVYWELVPVHTTRTLLTRLASQMAMDKKSAAVRAAVLAGFAFILDNHLSHPVLRKLLPKLAPLIHDTTRRVRVAFCELLLSISSIRNIHFNQVVSEEHLLKRLSADANVVPVASRLSKLLLPSFFPQDAAGSEQLRRCIELVRRHGAAARAFHCQIHRHLGVTPVCKLATLLLRCVRSLVRNGASAAAASGAGGAGGAGAAVQTAEPSGRQRKRSRAKTSAAAEEATAVEGDTISAANVPLMAEMFTAMGDLWASVRGKLMKPACESVLARMETEFGGDVLLDLMAYPPFAASADIQTALLRLAGMLRSGALPGFRDAVRRSLDTICDASSSASAVARNSEAAKLRTLVPCLCAWGMGAVVGRAGAELLEHFLADDDDAGGEAPHAKKSRGSKGGKARGKGGKAATAEQAGSSATAQADLAADIVSALIDQAGKHPDMLGAPLGPEMEQLRRLLERVPAELMLALKKAASLDEPAAAKARALALSRLLFLNCKLLLHLSAAQTRRRVEDAASTSSSSSSVSASDAIDPQQLGVSLHAEFKDILQWVVQDALPVRRKGGGNGTASLFDHVILGVATVAADWCAVGTADLDAIATFFGHVLGATAAATAAASAAPVNCDDVLLEAFRALFQISRQNGRTDLTQNALVVKAASHAEERLAATVIQNTPRHMQGHLEQMLTKMLSATTTDNKRASLVKRVTLPDAELGRAAKAVVSSFHAHLVEATEEAGESKEVDTSCVDMLAGWDAVVQSLASKPENAQVRRWRVGERESVRAWGRETEDMGGKSGRGRGWKRRMKTKLSRRPG